MTVTFLVFRSSLAGGFVNWDDDFNFLHNPAYRGLGAENIRWMFTTFYLGPYQPLSWLTLGMDYAIWGMDPYGYHLTSVILHVINAGLVYVLALQLLGATGQLEPRQPLATAGRFGAAAAALLFALHPLRVESVAWVTERRDVLSGFFFLLSALAYVRAVVLDRSGRSSILWLALSVASFAASLASKAAAMALPAALLVIDIWLLGRLEPNENGRTRSLKSLVLEKVPFAVLALGAALLAAKGQQLNTVFASAFGESVPVRVAHGFYGLWFVVWKTIAPFSLSNLYEVPFRANALDPRHLAAVGGIVGITAATFFTRTRWPAIFAAWACYVVLLLPASGIAHPGGEIVADRYSYIPCIAFALLAGGGVVFVRRMTVDGRVAAIARALPYAAITVLALLALMTIRQIPVWHDSVALWQNAFDRHPLERLRQAGAQPAAIQAYEATLATLGPLASHRVICLQFGQALRVVGRSADAARVLASGAASSPWDAEVRNSWGAALLELGQVDEAAAVLEEAVRLDPKHRDAAFNFAVARASQGRTSDAMTAYNRAIANDPENAVAHYNLGVLLADANRLPEAAAEYQSAIRLKPDYGEAYNNLGVALGRQGRTNEAIEAFRRALTLNPANASARQNLNRALAARGGGG